MTALASIPLADLFTPGDPERALPHSLVRIGRQHNHARPPHPTWPLTLYLAKIEKDLRGLSGSDDVVIPVQRVVVHIEYPLKKPATAQLTANDPRGFTRADLARQIAAAYARIYEEEERTATTKTVPVAERKTMANRNQTDGTYRICCHDLGDLVLEGAEFYEDAAGGWHLYLSVGS